MSQEASASDPAKSVEQLLKFHDEDFVRCAYLSVLGRPADPSGLAAYLRHVRRGADKKDLLVALATSPEGEYFAAERMPGLKELVEAARHKRRSLLSRVVRRFASEAFGPLNAQLEAYERRLIELKESMQDRFDRLEAIIEQLSQASGVDPALRNQETEALKQMTLHARTIYFQLKDMAARVSQTTLS